MKKGTYVTRAKYQQVVEENKRLMRDIRVLICNPCCPIMDNVEEFDEVVNRWTEHFNRHKEFNNMLIEVLNEAKRQRSVASKAK
jgi:hypothetical protein